MRIKPFNQLLFSFGFENLMSPANTFFKPAISDHDLGKLKQAPHSIQHLSQISTHTPTPLSSPKFEINSLH